MSIAMHGFKQCKSDYSLFVFGEGTTATFLLVYVDDIIIVGPDNTMIKRVEDKPSTVFKLKFLGDLKFFLELELAKSSEGIFLSQCKCALSLVGCKLAPSPMDVNSKLRASEGEILADPSTYRKLIRRLMYLIISKLDITFAVTKLAQFTADPRVPQLNAVHHIHRYLKVAPSQGILFSTINKFNLSVYADADWKNCLDIRRSTIGYCAFLGDLLVSWKNNKQTIVSRSSTKAEYKLLQM
ncbi:uncharacterized mitochondrial protein AtMg00810-like [Arachis stenosperma]|uniref:uncharacterized mitochondrial protein AtMg00810-like n=1 Tax=Arachis stenosperma TaxID=217475 RepID=UPI0025AD581F|nr:uncharacterized mitochondrial protein AtMg00810-like [Arachis stenosperma]